MVADRPLGRRIPPDWEHVSRFPARVAIPRTATTVEKVLRLPKWHWTHDQGFEGSCVGHAVAMERAITNTAQNRLLALLTPGRRYNPIHIWNEAKKIDVWADTNPGDDNGTSVRAGYDVARMQGLERVKTMELNDNLVPIPINVRPVNLNDGILHNRWATTVDEIRTAIAQGIPVTIGVNWYAKFDNPVETSTGFWIGRQFDLGEVRGGHALTIYGASDKRQAFRLKNSWGREYPLVWMPYRVMQRLLSEWGEAALVTDR